MLSKSQIQFLRGLQDKKARMQAGVFLVEGKKGILEFLTSDMEIVEGFFTEKFVSENSSSLLFRSEAKKSLSKSSHDEESVILSKVQKKGIPAPQGDFSSRFARIHLSEGQKLKYSIISSSELDRITTLQSNDAGVMVVKMRENTLPNISPDELVLVLDSINDPGNLGTIIRIADWYGIRHIIASPDTVDCYNPKVVIATMGSLTRVSVSYNDLDEYLASVIAKNEAIQKRSKTCATRLPHYAPLHSQGRLPVYGAYLDGESIHTKKLTTRGGYLVIGSESHGISPELEKHITDKITIPRFGGAESLNAGVATGIIVDRICAGILD